MQEVILNEDNLLYRSAVEFFKNKDYSNAYSLYERLGLMYECGYCKLMSANLFEAEKIWQKCNIDSPAVKWGLALIKLIDMDIPTGLTFFQVRNFLERDLSLLLENNHFQYAQNVISAADILYEYNPETYKFIGRALMNEGYMEQAIIYLNKAKNACYSDPEIHYLLAQYYALMQDKNTAISILKNSSRLHPEYFPVSALLKELTESI